MRLCSMQVDFFIFHVVRTRVGGFVGARTRITRAGRWSGSG